MASSHGLALGLSFLLLVVIVQSEKQPQNTTVVSHLPGYHGPLPFSLQTGYVEVDKGNGVRLFYYFIQSERSPAEDPVLLWLTGGPGCSAFSGLVYEIGPLSFQSHSYVDGLPELVHRPDSWTKVANIIFLDSPVGAGFSYAATDDGYKSSDTITINQIAIFLTKWYEEHSEFLLNPLYIAGDSYSGLIVPPLTFRIARGIKTDDRPLLNLKGYIIGNPLTDVKIDMAAKVPYAHMMGLISDEQYEIYRESCSSVTGMPQNMRCTNCLDAIDKCLKGINTHHILEPECSEYDGNSSGDRMLLDYNSGQLPLSDISSECRDTGYTMSSIWANDRAVREALGVHTETVPLWVRCNHGMPYTTDIWSSLEYHRSVTSRGYRSLIYSGDHDMTVPFIGTQAWIRSLGAVVDEWRPWYVTGQVAGFATVYFNNITFATVKGAGHTAPEYKPKQCLAMVSSWLSNSPL
ncbi:serine carboxypeptidase-like 17 [Lolium rigidum]|uniref:serine carboxypeptidase-like 17 n=1 Tax=Lolium rigidum TaxID=89674 RepID=UPI001F5C15E6|nr:serine carboxypeptidase-like 17 [Lolium rigidum]